MHLIKNTDYVKIFHQPPMRRSINYEGIIGNNYPNKTRFFLSFPNILFKIVYNKQNFDFSMYVAFTNPQLDKFYYPALFNININYQVCMGDDYNYLEERISPEQLIQDFWNSTFNDELSSVFHYYSCFKIGSQPEPSILSNLNNWENKTKKEPLWIPDSDMIESDWKWYNW